MSIPESKFNIEGDLEARSKVAWLHKHPVHNQNFVVLSIVDRGSPPAAIKIFGTFSSIEEANRVSAEIGAENDFFDVLVADTNEWLPCPASRHFIEDIHYQEQKMNDIRDGFTQLKENNAKRLSESIKKDVEDKKARALAAEEAGGGPKEEATPELAEA